MMRFIAGIILSAIMAANACTVWVIAPDISASGQFIIHKTRDRGIWRQLKTKLRWYPEPLAGKYRLLEFGDWMYMNEKGLFIFNTNIPKARDAVKNMESIAVTMRNVASQCANIDEAIEKLKSYVNSKDHVVKHTFYIISDHTGAIMVEISTTNIGYRRIEHGYAVHTNHFYFPEMAYLYNGKLAIPSATRLEITKNELCTRLEAKGKLSEMDSLEISRFVMPENKYPAMSPFRPSTVCCADYLPDSEFPEILGTLLITPGPSYYAPAMSVPICIGKIPAPLEDGTLGTLSYEVKEKLPNDEATLNKFRELETQLRKEYVECQESARKLLKENKVAEAKKMLDENVAKQAEAVLQMFHKVIPPAKDKN